MSIRSCLIILLVVMFVSCSDSPKDTENAGAGDGGGTSSGDVTTGGPTTDDGGGGETTGGGSTGGGAATEFLRFGYLDVPNGDLNWANYDQLFDKTYTHIILSGMLPQADGSVVDVDSMIDFNATLIAKAKAGGVKVLASIGGSSVPYSTYVTISKNAAARDKFINKIVQVIHDKGLDGIDLNFEGWSDGMPQADINAGNNLASLLAQAIKNDDPNKLVTVTMAVSYYLPMGFECSFINSVLVDYAHHMSYDFFWGTTTGANGPWRAPGEDIWLPGATTPIERSVYGALKYLVDKGCNAKKMTSGIPFFTTKLELWNEVRDRAAWAAIQIHKDYLEKLENTVKPYSWVNDKEAAQAKVTAYKGFGLAGVMVWQVGQEGSVGDLSQYIHDAAVAE